MAGVRLLLAILTIHNALLVAGTLHPLSDVDKAAAQKLFVARDDSSFGSLEETYQAVRSLQVLKSGEYDGQKISKWVAKSLTSGTPNVKDIFFGVKTLELVHGKEGKKVGTAVAPKVLAVLKDAESLLDLYFTVGALATIRRHHWIDDARHAFGPAVGGVFQKMKALDGGDGKWVFAKGDKQGSAEAAGYAYDIAAWSLEIEGLEGHKADVQSMKTSISKVLDSVELHEDEAEIGSERALTALSSVLQGITAFAHVLPEGIRVKDDTVFGLAKFFLSCGTPGSARAAYYQLDALSILEDNRLVVPLAVRLPSTVLSVSSQDWLEVDVTTVLGSPAPEVVVTLISAHKSGSRKPGSPLLADEELVAAEGDYKYIFDFVSKIKDVGKYDLKLDVKPVSAELSHKYSAGGVIAARIVTTGKVSVSSVELSVLNSDSGTPESSSSLDFSKKDKANLVANHLQKLHLSFELTSPLGGPYKPQEVFLKLSHESGYEHLFVVKPSGKRFEKTLDFLGLLETLYYQSGIYKMELVIGDVTMENSFLWTLGSLDLDLPEAPEGAAKPPAVPVDSIVKFGPKAEIAHIFRVPEKRPRADVSYAFLVLTLLPLLGFLAGLAVVGANMKIFPTSGAPGLSAVGFHVGIGAILTLYALFWIKFDLFTTLKALGFLGLFTCVTGHFILSHLSDVASKVKTS